MGVRRSKWQRLATSDFSEPEQTRAACKLSAIFTQNERHCLQHAYEVFVLETS